MRWTILLALAGGRFEVIEFAVSEDVGETDRLPAVSRGDCTGEPREGTERIDGAEGGDDANGAEARNSLRW